MELFHCGEAEPGSRQETGSTCVGQWGSQPGKDMAELETGITVRAQAGIKAQTAVEFPALPARAVWAVPQ